MPSKTSKTKELELLEQILDRQKTIERLLTSTFKPATPAEPKENPRVGKTLLSEKTKGPFDSSEFLVQEFAKSDKTEIVLYVNGKEEQRHTVAGALCYLSEENKDEHGVAVLSFGQPKELAFILSKTEMLEEQMVNVLLSVTKLKEDDN